MNKRNLISLSVALVFLGMGITGILMYLKQKAHVVEITHTMFGLVFLGFAVFHIANNWASLKSYGKERRSGKWQKELGLAAAIAGLLLLGSATGVLEPVAEAGRVFAKQSKRAKRSSFEQIAQAEGQSGQALRLWVEKQGEVQLPVAAVWVEDSAGRFVENLFVPAQITVLSKPNEDPAEAIAEGEVSEAPLNPDLLPAWKAATQAAQGPQAATHTQATPNDSFVLQASTRAQGPYTLKVEVAAQGKTEVYQARLAPGQHTASRLVPVGQGTMLSSVFVVLE